MSEPRWIDVATPAVQLRALVWGPEDGPVALCLHGFPDTANGWRKVAPVLAEAGWKVVAPFMRGYVPSSIPTDGSYHVGALMDDALRLLEAVGPTGRDVIIGHDWGAMAASGVAALPDNPFSKAVIMSVPPLASFQPLGRVPDAGKLLAQLPRQALRSWYMMYFQLPWLPERSASWVVPRLWKAWSPGYDATQDLRHVDAAIGAPDRWRAALGYYRATVRMSKPPAQYAELHDHWLLPPVLPSLYLHGTDDGCAAPDYARWVQEILPAGSAVNIVEAAGHFLQLDQPEVVAQHIVDFIGSPAGN
ncbi:alpha/beta fold hydrolase [Mycolicibacterium fortuitum]|uniref:Epoxide hydrolase n=2 Tax=Mycolicibacterium fortuitum TaxID=1766 RepID=A0A0N9XHZ5_MYCFO|nr:alpha/beta fold hydrolase [Mycolicibacterium fortuitum]AIY47890.1 putative epoxide hydrolase ephC [Mycobacterium sp. VKM Ac-1817D]CRL71201.1 alpha/beta hydrolase fold protein [Mycolicibacter nonchromogenicus]ALI28438.1 putative epoxide hydrolase ephC [Mycolicibacterium fortuitum]EJZ07935.1 alpha/beta hydrolase fold protein [Mycolicibacterium fortuitum subsp. fortuitum DSM 46621 = ATCC 6841 = JCM 6387]OBG48662.1 epoxide hydrolase [Mycolicibacterium fortuitum]